MITRFHLAVAFTLFAFATAVAAPRSEAPTQIVHYQDLNLSRPADAAVLYARIRRAAEQVCRPAETEQFTLEWLRRECIAATVEKAVAGVNQPNLTARHLEQTRRQSVARLDP